ncbi:MAG TPA: hypothetical protein VLM88_06975 [Proteiniclasticum sp.]|nr:hypothetical protein [Proteiniclasticum sp.]
MYKEEKFKEKWKVIISNLSKSYLVRTRMLFYGLASVVVLELIYPFLNNNFSFSFIYEEGFIFKFIFMGLFSFMFGLFFGLIMWLAYGNKKVKL